MTAPVLTTALTATTPETLLDRWQDFLEHDLVPLGRVALAVLVVAAVLGAVSRLLVVAVPAWPPLRHRARVVALAVTLGGTSASVLTLGTAVGPLRGTALTTGLLLGAASVALGAWWLATRLRLSITATARDGSDVKTSAAHIAALLGDLGAAPPRGLEVPRGSDVSGLGTALGDTPQGKIAQTALALLQQIVGSSPWHALVDAVDDDTVAVTITRNGRQAGAAVVDRNALRVGTDLRAYDDNARHVDLHRFAAAVVLTTLARSYPDAFRGLCGATDWRSLGLHYVATTDFRENSEVQRVLLGWALELDPGNWLAQLAYQRAVRRFSTDPDVLDAYRDWVTDLLPDVLSRPGFEPLRLRALYTRVSLAINAAFARDPEHPVFGPDARTDAAELVAALDGTNGSMRQLAEQLRVAARPLVAVIDEHTAPPGTATHMDVAQGPSEHADPMSRHALSPQAHYNTACYLASGRHPDVRAAVGELRLAAATPVLRDWMHRDPELTTLRATTEFREAFGTRARTDLLGLDVVAPFADALRRAGLTTPDSILAVAERDLRSQTGATKAEVAVVRGAAGLRASMPARLDPWAVEVLHELGRRGIWTSDALVRAATGMAQKRALVGEVAGAVGGRVLPTEGGEGASLRTALARWVEDAVFGALSEQASDAVAPATQAEPVRPIASR